MQTGHTVTLPSSPVITMVATCKDWSNWYRDPTGTYWGIPRSISDEDWDYFTDGGSVECSTCKLNFASCFVEDLLGKELPLQGEVYCSPACAKFKVNAEFNFQGTRMVLEDATCGLELGTLYEAVAKVYDVDPSVLHIEGTDGPLDTIGTLMGSKPMINTDWTVQLRPREILSREGTIQEEEEEDEDEEVVILSPPKKSVPLPRPPPVVAGVRFDILSTCNLDEFPPAWVAETMSCGNPKELAHPDIPGELWLCSITRYTALQWFNAFKDLAHAWYNCGITDVCFRGEVFRDRAVLLIDNQIKFLPFVGPTKHFKDTINTIPFLQWLLRRILGGNNIKYVEQQDASATEWATALKTLRLTNDPTHFCHLLTRLAKDRPQVAPVPVVRQPDAPLSYLTAICGVSRFSIAPPAAKAFNLMHINHKNVLDVVPAFQHVVEYYYHNSDMDYSLINCKAKHIFIGEHGTIFLEPGCGNLVPDTTRKEEFVYFLFRFINRIASKMPDCPEDLMQLCNAFGPGKDRATTFLPLIHLEDLATARRNLLQTIGQLMPPMPGDLVQLFADHGLFGETGGPESLTMEVDIALADRTAIMEINHYLTHEYQAPDPHDMDAEEVDILAEDKEPVEVEEPPFEMPEPEGPDAWLPYVETKKERVGPKTHEELVTLADQTKRKQDEALEACYDELRRMSGKVVDKDFVPIVTSDGKPVNHGYSLDPDTIMQEVREQQQEDDDDSSSYSDEDDDNSKRCYREGQEEQVTTPKKRKM